MITKTTSNLTQFDYLSGQVMLVDKPKGWTSFKVVDRIRRCINVKKVGHAGTLDPMATGLLILCTGKKTKEITQYQDLTKTYSGVITLGKYSESMDAETEMMNYPLAENLSITKINEVAESFIGEIEQIPPMYSAIKKNGKTLYNLARKGKVVEREARKIIIYSFTIDKINLPNIHFTIESSKGTYIRVIADEFGKKLDTRAVLTELRRTKIGEYEVDQAADVNEFISDFKKELVESVTN